MKLWNLSLGLAGCALIASSAYATTITIKAKNENELKTVDTVKSHQIELYASYNCERTKDTQSCDKNSRTIKISGLGYEFNVSGLFLYNVKGQKPSLTPPTFNFRRGDSYDIRLVNNMPNSLIETASMVMDGQKHAVNYRDTNLHLHGLIVAPLNPKVKRQDGIGSCASNSASHEYEHHNKNKYGDYALVTLKPIYDASSKVRAESMVSNAHTMSHNCKDEVILPTEFGHIDYHYKIPQDHPAGLSWYHPHIHGTSSAQVGGGMAGLITIGDIREYAHIKQQQCMKIKNKWVLSSDTKKNCPLEELEAWDAVKQRTLLLKDFQVQKEADNQWRYALQDPNSGNPKVKWCGETNPQQNDKDFLGTCSDPQDPNRLWLFTTNGQLAPVINIKDQQPDEIWRIANMSANVTHKLRLLVGKTTRVGMTVLSQDGVALSSVHQSEIVLMPGARVEVVVTTKALQSALGDCKKTGDASCGDVTLVSIGVTTGKLTKDEQKGDVWPSNITMAKVKFNQNRKYTPVVITATEPVVSPSGMQSVVMSTAMGASNLVSTSDSSGCEKSNNHHLNSDQYRLLGVKNYKPNPTTDEWFRMGYGGEHPRPTSWNGFNVPTLVDSQYSDFGINCPLTIEADIDEQRNASYQETWVIKNDSDELHNFHLHQTKFEILYSSAVTSGGASMLGENNQLYAIQKKANDLDDQRAESRAASAYPKVDVFPINPGQWIAIRVTFDHKEQYGTYVYHCHILEHEDKGMMALIKVVPPATNCLSHTK